jgi:hypothetical protein
MEGSMACAVDHAVRAAGDLLSSVIAGSRSSSGRGPAGAGVGGAQDRSAGPHAGAASR